MLADCPTNQSSQATESGIDPMAFYNALWHNPNHGMYVVDVLDEGADFRFLDFNMAMAAASPIPVAQLQGKRLGDAFPSAISDVYRQHYTDCVHSAQVVVFEEKLTAVGGDTWWNLSVYPVKSATGEIIQLIVTATDITARRQATSALEASCQVLQQVIDTLPSIIFWKNRESHYLGCNQAFADISGNENSTALFGKDDYDLPWKKEEADWFVRCDQRVMQTNCPELNIIEPQLQADGKQAWLSTSKIPLHDANGEVTGILGIIEDITAHKETQDNQARLLAILEATPDIVAIADAEGNNRYINRAGQLIFGIPLEKVCHSHIQDVVPPEIFEMLMREALPTAAQVGNWYGESLIRNHHGHDIPVSQVIICHQREDGTVESFSTIMRDISDRKAAEISLQETAERQAVLNQITTEIRNSLDLETVIATTLQALHEGLKLDYCGFAWLSVSADEPCWEIVQAVDDTGFGISLGAHPDDRLGPDLQKLVDREITRVDDRSQCTDLAHQAFLNRLGICSEILIPILTETDQIGVIVCYVVQQVHPWCVDEVELLQAVGNQVAIAINQANLYTQSYRQSQALAESLDQLKRTQSQIVQSEKMSSLGQMVAGVAHEINNPVNFIHGNLNPVREYAQDLLGLIALYQKTYTEPTAEIISELEAIDLDFIQADLPNLLNSMFIGTRRIREIVLSLRNFSRLDESAFKTVDLHDGIESTLVILSHRLKETDSNQKVTVIKHYAELPEIDCYPGQLNQVLMNILVNAIDALANTDNPQITITTALHDDSSEKRPDQRVSIRIADNGLGIEPDIQPYILDPFFTTKPVGKGTGMGMSISYQIITEKHGGTLTFSSEVGKGTAFVIELPIRQPEVA